MASEADGSAVHQGAIYTSETMDRIREMEGSHTDVRADLSGRIWGRVIGLKRRARKTKFTEQEVQAISVVWDNLQRAGNGSRERQLDQRGDRSQFDR